MTLSMGPQHPSTHGVLRFVVRADGEVMKEAIPDIGYLHRSIEKIAEKVGWHGFMPYTDRVDYVAAMPGNQGWAMAAERLAAIEVPKRGEYCRVIATEFSRIHSHLLSVGSMAMDIGAYTPFTHAIREREYINDLLEELCGARLTFHYMRIGGVGWDLPPGCRDKALAYIKHFKPPAGDCYVRLESARGDMGWYVVSDGTAFPYRCKIRTGSFAAISIVPKVSRNLMIADLIAVIASLDLVAPEIDR